MIDELNRPYIQMAKAKNLPFLRIVGLHAFRNASIPALTLAGWEFIRALAGFSVIVETVFAWPGIGYTAIQAIERSDLILLQAIVFVVAVLIVAINIAIDVAYKAIEAATVFCKMRGNPYVELVHWLHQILQLQDSDLHRIMKQFNVDPSRLAADITHTECSLIVTEQRYLDQLRGLAPDLIITQGLCEVCAVADGEVHRISAAMNPAPFSCRVETSAVSGCWGIASASATTRWPSRTCC
jgi:hypothetical protein